MVYRLPTSLCLGLVWASAFCNFTTRSHVAVAETMYPKFEGYTLESHSQVDSISDSYLYNSQKVPGSIRLRRAVKVDPQAATMIINNEILAIQAYYSGALAPYPDAISNSIVPDRSLIPELREITHRGVLIKFCVTHLSISKAHGVQTAKDAAYKGVLAWAYCSEQREARTFEVIAPINLFSDELKQFAVENICRPST